MPSYAPAKLTSKRVIKRPHPINLDWQVRLASLRYYAGQLASVATTPADREWFEKAQKICVLGRTPATNRAWLERIQRATKYINYGLGAVRPKGANP